LVAHVEVSPDAVAGIGSQVGAAASIPTTPAATVSPPAQDPVSVGVAQTFAARVSAIAEYSAAGGVITNVRADMVTASATGYQQQEQVNQASLTNGSSGPAAAAAPSMPVPAIPSLSPPVVAPPSIGAPPASGRAISQLIHSGAGPEGLFAAAQQMRQHAGELSATASQLRQSANGLGQEWDSAAGREAASRVNELGSWYDGHAQHATAAATALEHQGENFGRARAAIATPQQFDDLQRRLETAVAANQAPDSFGRYAPVIAQLQAQLGKLNAETVAHYGDYASGAADPSVVGDPLQAPPRPGGDVQAVGFDMPLSPQGEDPPHGKDPRYWIDVTKIIHVPEGQLAPYGTTQIGPGLFYPTGNPYAASDPPPAAKYPLDASDILYYPPGGPQLPPYGTAELSPGYYTPSPGQPGSMIPPSATPPSWPAPQQPIDVRDVINVPRGSLAPWGYIEYLPEWFAPGPQLTNTPTIPQPR
jgi:hypothetical protein